MTLGSRLTFDRRDARVSNTDISTPLRFSERYSYELVHFPEVVTSFFPVIIRSVTCSFRIVCVYVLEMY